MNLKGLFFKETEEDKIEEVAPKKEEPVKQPQQTAKVVNFGSSSPGLYSKPLPASIPPQITSTGGQPSNDYNQTFLELIQTAQVKSPGYPQFFNALRKFDNKPYTDQQKFENVFIGLESAGATVDNIVSTAQQVLQIVNAQETHFNEEMSEFEANEISSKTAQAQKLKEENERLQAQINDNALRAQTLEQEAYTAGNQLAIERSSFERSLQGYQSMIQSHINNIQTYLNNGKVTTI